MRTPFSATFVCLSLFGVFVWPCAASAQDGVPSADRHRELVRLVRQDCGSCHGLTLAGGLGPSLLPEDMAGKPPEALVATILHGRPGTAMPGWSQFMNEAEAEWVVEALRAGFPQDKPGVQ